MSILSIDQNKCNHCGLCARVCLKNVLVHGADGGPQVAEGVRCMECGHCIAVCPSDAISHADMPADRFIPIAGNLPSADLAEVFLRSKRSVRHYANKEIERDVLERLIDLGSHAPSAKNAQNRSFIVITDREKIRQIDRAVCEDFARVARLLSWPVRRMLSLSMPAFIRNIEKVLPSLRALKQRSDAGEYPIFYDAPCVVFTTGPKGYQLAKDTNVSSQQYIMLQAHAMGLGSCMIGYASTRPKTLAKFVDVPAGHMILTATTLGYPTEKYLKTVPRRLAKTSWV